MSPSIVVGRCAHTHVLKQIDKVAIALMHCHTCKLGVSCPKPQTSTITSSDLFRIETSHASAQCLGTFTTIQPDCLASFGSTITSKQPFGRSLQHLSAGSSTCFGPPPPKPFSIVTPGGVPPPTTTPGVQVHYNSLGMLRVAPTGSAHLSLVHGHAWGGEYSCKLHG